MSDIDDIISTNNSSKNKNFYLLSKDKEKIFLLSKRCEFLIEY